METLEDDLSELQDEQNGKLSALLKRKAATLDDDDEEHEEFDEPGGEAANAADSDAAVSNDEANEDAEVEGQDKEDDDEGAGSEEDEDEGEAGSDLEREQDQEEEEDDEEGGGHRKKKHKGTAKHRRKKRRKQHGYQFLDDVADVDDDEEDDDEEVAEDGIPLGEFWYNGIAQLSPSDEKFIDEDNEPAPNLRDIDFRHDAFETRWNEEDEARIIEHYQQKDLQMQYASKDDDVLDQHSLLPSMTDDPKLWMVKCVAGAERGIVTQLMQKYITFMNREKPLSIFSAFCQDLSASALGSKREGHFYVEARTEKAVSDAVEGLRGVLRMKPMVRVPHAEMTDALTVMDSGRQDLQVGGWVRITGMGIYKGDLAQVLRLEGDGTITVKVVPRIDYSALRQRAENRKNGIKAAPFGGFRNGKGAVRPVAAAFNPEEAKAAEQVVETRRNEDNMYVMNARVFQDGYEHKRFSAKTLVPTKDPSLEEVQRFLASAVGAIAEDTERTLLAAAGASSGKFAVGDMVVVTSGDLKNLKGEVVELQGSGGRIVVLPKGLMGFSERIDFSPDELQKYVAVGARVKIVSGAHHVGDLGVVSHSKDGIAEVLLDSTDTTIKVLVNNLTETGDTRTRIESFGRYSLHQLVQLTDNDVGMIITISAEQAHLLMPTGGPKLRPVRQQDIRKQVDSRRIPAPDCYRQRITVQSLVEILDGPHKGKVGTVAHICKPHLWVHCRDETKNNGYVVVMSNMTRAKGGTSTSGSDTFVRLAPQSPAIGLRSPAHPSFGGPAGLQSPQHALGGGAPMMRGVPGPMGAGRGRGGFRGGRGRGLQDALIGKRVRAKRGAYRGYVGLVQHATDTHVRLELDATNKVVTIRREMVDVDDGLGARPKGPGLAGDMRLPPQTPMHAGSRTPYYTPSFEAMADPGSLPSTVDGGERGATPEIQTATPGTMPFTPGSNVGHATVSAALSVVDAPAGTGTLPAQTPGTLANAAVTAMTPASVGATPMSGSNVVGLLPTMTPGTAMFSRTPFTGVGATPGGLIEEGRDAASSYQLYIGAQVFLGDEKGVVESYDEGSNEVCIVQGVERQDGFIDTNGEATRQLVPATSIRLVDAQVGDAVKIVKTSGRTVAGSVGHMIGKDNEEGIVKLQPSKDIQILPMKMIAKLNQEKGSSGA